MDQTAAIKKNILLAEDDEDDFLLFRDAIIDSENIPDLKWVRDGEELMRALKEDGATMPYVLFLDINMPRKNGFECLTEIRKDKKLSHLPVIIFSTSSDKALVNWMYNAGANLYLSKPTDFRKLKQSIRKAISMDWKMRSPYPPIEEFVLQ